MPYVAFKEWAIVCDALAKGTQAIIIRKGGIAEAGGEFRPDHSRFLLYPTQFHEQQQQGIKPEYAPHLERLPEVKPAAGMLRFTHFCEVVAVQHMRDLETASQLDRLHIWNEALIRQRFAYRTPGFFVLLVRVFQLKQEIDAIEKPEYAGCKTWVLLDELDGEYAGEPVLNDAEFEAAARQLRDALLG